MTLEERVREQIGMEGTQLPLAEYDARIDDELERMSAKRLLEILSYMFDWSHLEKRP